ncbi:ABC transporter permease [Niastella koreensis]|nr:branched-chain amino acid ABC transporter permease [Niastella koreensis]OQP40495.1 ABC transporter permease [Niastella koreensis]
MQLVLNTFLTFTLYLVIALSYSLIYYVTKFFHLAHGCIITCGAYGVLFFTTRCTFSMPLAIALSIVAVTLIGLLCEILVYRPMRKKKVSSLAYLIASLGIYVVLQNTIALIFGNDARILNSSEVSIGHRIGQGYITTVQAVLAIVSLLLFLSVTCFLRYTRTGKSVRAVASNPELCNIYGVRSGSVIIIAFGIGSFIAAIVGILSAMDTSMTPSFGFNLLVYGIVAMIVGGVGSTRGLITGSLLVATAQNLAGYYIDTKWTDAITYLLLIIFLIWRPLGFSGQLLKKVEL